jgi:hypothetical protein
MDDCAVGARDYSAQRPVIRPDAAVGVRTREERQAMRRSWVALLVVAAVTAIACAHPNEVPLPGESVSPSRQPTANTSGPDETTAVCNQAQSVSRTAVDRLLAKLDEAQSALASGNQAAALTAATAAKALATDWKEDLEGFAARPVQANVRAELRQGVELIDELLGTPPQNLDPTAARAEVEEFLDDLDRVCP